MHGPLTRFVFSSVLLSILAAVGGQARGEFVARLEVDVTQDASGWFTYSYLLTNQIESSLPMIGFSLDVSILADLSDITGPTGWAASYAAGDDHVSWESADGSTDVPAGGSARFSMRSLLGPGQYDYFATGFDEATFEVGISVGRITAPGPNAAVPEPSAVLLMLAAAPIGAILAGRGRRHARSSVAPPSRIIN